MRRRWYFSVLQNDQAEAWLEDLAQQGWMLQSIGYVFATFKKCEPATLRYACVLRKDFFDGQEEEAIKKAFAAAGWSYVGYREKILVFCAPEGTERPKLLQPILLRSRKSLFIGILLDIIVSTVLIVLYIVLILNHMVPVSSRVHGEIRVESLVFVFLFFLTFIYGFALLTAEDIRKYRESKRAEAQALGEKDEFRKTIARNRMLITLSFLAAVFLFAADIVNIFL